MEIGGAFASNNNGSALPNLAHQGDAYRIYANYKTDTMKFGLSYEGVDIMGDMTDDSVNYIMGIASMTVAPKTDLIASIGFVDDGPAEGVGGTVGVNYGIAEKTEVLLSASYGDMERGVAPKAVSLLFVHNFSISSN